jgi:hypothetical protein
MTRRWWLPYGAWALLVTVGALAAQFGSAIGYCVTLHPRLCASALVADRAGPWDLAVGVAILAAGWIVIAAGRRFGRRTALAFVAVAIVIGIPMLFFGPSIPMCLGPIGITIDQCRAAWSLPPETAWDRFSNGPLPGLGLLVAGWVAIAVIASRRRQRGSL